MNWVLEHLQILIGAAAAVAYLLNRGRGEQTARKQEPMADGGQAERTRQVQEEIRRKIAERRAAAGGTPSASPARKREFVPPLVRPAHVPPLDPFGGPMRRIIKELETAAEKRFEPEREAEQAAARAALERQEKLAEELRALEAARFTEQRRAAEIAAVKRERRPVPVGVEAPLNDLSAQLRDPRELRRAFVLREVIGAPVALR